jgi:asparagine synthase (glutamine-hydrolysing)
VALSGDGADEFFGGYATYKASRLAAAIGAAFPSGVASAAGRLLYAASGANETRLPFTALLSRFLLGIAAGGGHAHAEWRRYVPEFLVPRLYDPRFVISRTRARRPAIAPRSSTRTALPCWIDA